MSGRWIDNRQLFQLSIAIVIDSAHLYLQGPEWRPQQPARTWSGDTGRHHQHSPTRSDQQRLQAVIQDFCSEKQLQSQYWRQCSSQTRQISKHNIRVGRTKSGTCSRSWSSTLAKTPSCHIQFITRINTIISTTKTIHVSLIRSNVSSVYVPPIVPGCRIVCLLHGETHPSSQFQNCWEQFENIGQDILLRDTQGWSLVRGSRSGQWWTGNSRVRLKCFLENLKWGNFLFRNQYGSSRYASFLSGLGTLVDITITDQTQVFLGGLDPRDDGQLHLMWQD